MTQTWAIDVPAGRGSGDEIAVARLDLYIGPQVAELLQSYGQGLEDSMDMGWKVFRPLAKIVLVGMNFAHRYIANYGVIIIIFSVLTKLMFYPLTKSSTESMKKMQAVQPKLKALQEKHKNDKDKLNQATMKLYSEEKVNPLAGCLPLLVQSPVFIALYQALNHTIALRGQPFVWWIKDLSQPDAIATLPFALPFLGQDLNILPILMSVAMYFQTKFTPNTGGSQMALMNTMLPLFMIFIFYSMPSGLVLYWLINTLMQGYQSWKIHKDVAPAGGGIQTA
jgi:YidC/Oxa1 family membrane protein insertase